MQPLVRAAEGVDLYGDSEMRMVFTVKTILWLRLKCDGTPQLADYLSCYLHTAIKLKAPTMFHRLLNDIRCEQAGRVQG